MKRNLIAHYQSSSSDKIYIASVRALPNGQYEVLGKWGKRHCQRIQLMVKGSFSTLSQADQLMRVLFQEKLNKGYTDITSPDYTGTVTSHEVAKFLEVEADDGNKVNEAAEVKVKEEKPFVAQAKGLIVRCMNNLGLEHLFEVGVEYNAETTGDAEMLRVTDMTGTKTEVFAERFERLK